MRWCRSARRGRWPRRCRMRGTRRSKAPRMRRFCRIAKRSSTLCCPSSMTEPAFPAPDPRDVDPAAVRRGFERAAATYDAAAALQREIGARMAERLDYVKLPPVAILDAGCGTGEAIGDLGVRYPAARVVAFDIALPMVVAARRRVRAGRGAFRRLLWPFASRVAVEPAFVCADINRLPFAGVSY